MTKTLSTLLALSLAACGAVESTPASPADDDGSGDQPDAGSATPDAPQPMDAIMLEAPRAATTPHAITAMDHTTHLAMVDFIDGHEVRDVSEQRFTTLTDATVPLYVKLTSTPTTIASRTIVTDIGEQGSPIAATSANHEWCSANHDTIALDNPHCNLDRPVDSTLIETHESTTAVWSVWVYDESSMGKVGCARDPDGALCLLPAQANHSYRVVVSVTNVTELWDSNAYTIATSQGREYVGYKITQPYCSDYARDATTQNYYCNTHYDYQSPVGLDAASMTFIGISTEITANGTTATEVAPSYAWSYGDEDFPGSTY